MPRSADYLRYLEWLENIPPEPNPSQKSSRSVFDVLAAGLAEALAVVREERAPVDRDAYDAFVTELPERQKDDLRRRLDRLSRVAG